MTNLTDRLGELVGKVTSGPVLIHKCPCGHHRCDQYTLSNQGGVGFERNDAEFIALCFTHKDEILSALRKAEERCEHGVRHPHPCDECLDRDIPPGKRLSDHPCYGLSALNPTEFSHRSSWPLSSTEHPYCSRCGTEIEGPNNRQKDGARLCWEPRAAIATLSERKAEGGWLPIESAPTDGTVILLTSVAAPLWKYPFPAKWCKKQDWWVFADEPLNDVWGVSGLVTHWMPLPAPPATGGSND